MHNLWRLKLVAGLEVSCFKVEAGGGVVLVGDEYSVMRDGLATSLGWLFPCDVDELVINGLDLDISWLRYADGWNVLLVEDALFVNLRLAHEKGTWVRN